MISMTDDDETIIILKSTLNAMRQQEEIYLPDYYLPNLKEDDLFNSGKKKTPHWRSTMVDWCYYIASELLELQNPDIVPITMNIFDRFMSNITVVDDNNNNGGVYYYKLAIIGCFFLSLKVHKEYEIIDIESFVSLIQFTSTTTDENYYTKQQILDIELKILQTIQWRLNPPTPMAFVHCFLPFVISKSSKKVLLNKNKTKMMMKIIQQQIELGIKDNLLVGSHASYMALAAITNAMNIINNNNQKKKNILLQKNMKKIISKILSENNMCIEDYTFYKDYLWNSLMKKQGLLGKNNNSDDHDTSSSSKKPTPIITAQQHSSNYITDDEDDDDDDDDDDTQISNETMFSSSSSPRGIIEF